MPLGSVLGSLAGIETSSQMIISPIQTKRSRHDLTRGPRRVHWRIALALVALASLGLETSAGAAPQGPSLFADRELGDLLIQAVQSLGPDVPRLGIQLSARAAACAETPGSAPRLALLASTPTRVQLEHCGQSASAEVSIVDMGRQAVAVVVPINSPVWSVNATGLFRALGLNSGETVQATTWNEIDPSYPTLPIGLLAPSARSRSRHLFDALIMQSGCDRAATARTPFDLKSRAAFCAALRTDIQVSQHEEGDQGLANWAAAAPPGQIAITSVDELRQLEHRMVPLLLDGALPTAANIDSGRYPAAEKIDLMIVMPLGASQTQRTEARDLAFNLLAEGTIGPMGRLAHAGLIPLPPPERIAARSQAIAFLEQR
jgi:ABC-type phosphate transport system substrate-binding protein